MGRIKKYIDYCNINYIICKTNEGHILDNISDNLYKGGPLPDKLHYFKNTKYCKYIFTPLYYLLQTCPSMPDNLQGGIVGYIAGTHILNSCNVNKYIGSILSLRWARVHIDLRDNIEWHNKINHYITNNYNTISITPSLKSIKRFTSRSSFIHSESVIQSIYNYIVLYTYDYPIIDNKLSYFNLEFIRDDECWICNQMPSRWHKWGCDHVFCQTCSFYMIEKDIPCPLCRKVSTIVQSYPIEHLSSLNG